MLTYSSGSQSLAFIRISKGLVRMQIFALQPQNLLLSGLGIGSGNLPFHQVPRPCDAAHLATTLWEPLDYPRTGQ